MSFVTQPFGRFTLGQLFAAIAVLASVMALLRSEGCGVPYAMVDSLAFSPDGKQLAVAKLNARNANVPGKNYVANPARTISLIDVESAKPTKIVERELRPGNQGPRSQFWRIGRKSLAFDSDGMSLFVLSFGGGEIRLMDLKSDSSARFFHPTGQDDVESFAISSDRTILATMTPGAGVTLVDTRTGKPLLNDPALFAFAYDGPSIGLSSDNQWLAIADQNQVRLHDTSVNLRVGPVISCSGPFDFAPEGHRLAVVNGKAVRVCDPSNNNVRVLACNGEVHNLQFTSDGKRLVLAIEDAVIVLDAETCKESIRLGRSGWVTALACSPVGDVVAIGDNHGSLTLWNTATGQSRIVQVPGRNGYPWTLPVTFLAIVFALCWFVRRKRAAAASSLSSIRGRAQTAYQPDA